RPLKPDAGNAAVGSEESEPDWRYRPCVSRAGLSIFMQPRDDNLAVPATGGRGSENGSAAANGSGYRNSRKVHVVGNQHPDLRVPFFVIPNGVRDSKAN